MVNEIINNLNDKKIISINNNLESIKVYASKDNIEKMKRNRENYLEDVRNERINSYETIIEELKEQNGKYFNQINEYEQKIANLETELLEYQLVE